MSSDLQVLIVEDQAIVRGLIERVLQDAFPYPRVAATREGAAGLELCRQLHPDLVVLDLELPDRDGFDLVHQLRDCAPRVKILILSAHTEPYVLHRVCDAGVDGFFDKNEQTPETLLVALRTIMEGRQYFSASVEKAIARNRNDPDSFTKVLSKREQELLRLLGQGLADQVIAERFKLSELTVRNHRRNIMAKIGVHSTPEMIRYALEQGFTRVKLRI
jgi:DNA-binding NarL/FixJ family response regulator